MTSKSNPKAKAVAAALTLLGTSLGISPAEAVSGWSSPQSDQYKQSNHIKGEGSNQSKFSSQIKLTNQHKSDQFKWSSTQQKPH